MPARRVLEMATRGGARAVGLEDQIGTVEVGKKADLCVLDLRGIGTLPLVDLASAIVYAADASNVRHVVVDGRLCKLEGELLTLDRNAVRERGQESWTRLRTDFEL